MRIIPTMTQSAAATWQLYNSTNTGEVCSSVSIDQATTSTVRIGRTKTTANLTAGDATQTGRDAADTNFTMADARH